MAITLEKRCQMRGYIMANSGIPTLDASNLTYEFENVRVHQSDIEDNAKNKLLREVNKLKSIPPNLEYLDDFRDGLTGTSGTAFLDKDSGEVIIAYTAKIGRASCRERV